MKKFLLTTSIILLTSPALANMQRGAPSSPNNTRGPIHITPQIYSVNQGINIDQTGPIEGSFPGQVSFNLIRNTFKAKVTGLGDPGATGCACVAGLQVTLTVGGPSFDAVEAYGGSFGVVQVEADTSYSDKVGLSSGVYVNKTSNGRIYGGSVGATVDSGGATPFMVGHESDLAIKAGAISVPYRFGYNVVNIGTGYASVIDSAYAVESGGGLGSGAFKNLFALATYGGVLSQPIATDGNFFISESSATVANIFNLSNVTVTGSILNFPNVVLTGGGTFIIDNVDFYGDPQPTIAGHVRFGATTAASSSCGSLSGAAGCMKIYVGNTPRYIPYF